ncbi:MarR family winged helix-turn-helix transcriptional regulator [Christiangramia echinicola]|uniref:DNA-binding transcriptional regulator, MarR family n=1 Tax=Christiangramia echinicola TaxID=279359 RepID=A0A1H1LC23_9FLAO|nr:MarR family winged helix-turn-helix transcriptional regulator [Christiangramia echinicola]SDR72141.1 DNA-binding transcriptional regulator, MarR family [Christiangramia echinicola]
MKNSIFNPDNQHRNLSSKIVAGLERISESFKVLLWEKAKVFGISPIQIQILIFIAYHKTSFCNVSNLAKEFNLTKATISDAVKVMSRKELITKDYNSKDTRSYNILLSEEGKRIVNETENFANPIKDQLGEISESDLKNLFETLSKLIHQLNQNGILTVQRTCYACNFYRKNKNTDYCNLLNKELLNSDIRLDCPEFEKSK